MVAKRNLPRRLAMILAASGFTASEVVSLLSELKLISASEFLDLVDADRELLGKPAAQSVAINPERPIPGDGSSMGVELMAQVERLLVFEAQMSKVDAAQALERTLLKRTSSVRPSIKFNPKDGFSRWLRQLSQDFSPSEILHAAASIRNSRVHGVSDDWLNKPESP